MNGVKQITAVSCFLACLESFLLDHGISKSQKELIQTLHQKGLCDANGWVQFPFANMENVCKEMNLTITEIQYHYPIDKKYDDGSLLIGTTDGGFHIRRFIKHLEDEKIIVMDPTTGKEYIWDKSLMESQKPIYYKIELIQHKNSNICL